MFLLYAEDDDEQHCLQLFTDNDGDQMKRHRYKGADFFVRLPYNTDIDALSRIMNESIENKDTHPVMEGGNVGSFIAARTLPFILR